MTETKPSTRIIFVGYRLKEVPYLDDLLAVIPEGDDDKSKAAAVKARDKVRTCATENLYTCTFDEVFLAIPSVEKARLFKAEGRKAGDSVSSGVRNFLLKLFPQAWPDELFSPRTSPEAIFMGFDPRFFLKLLGLECSMPMHECALPVSMWYGNSDHRDIGEAVMPKTETKQLDWPMVLAARGLGMAADDKARYDAMIKNWPGPGVHPQQDVDIVIELATQLGFLRL